MFPGEVVVMLFSGEVSEWIGGVPVHPVASLFPMADDDVLAALAEDIRVNGLREPIVTVHNGGRADNVIVVDGRNRFRACELAGVEPVFTKMRALDNASLEYGAEDITDESLSKWIISHNLHRRHLNPSQRACVATDFLELLESAAKQRQIDAVQRGNVSRHDDSPVPENLPELARKDRTKESAEQAAAMLSVSGRSVRDANYIKKNNPEAFNKVRSGAAAVSAVAKQIRAEQAPRPELAPEEKAQKEAERLIRKHGTEYAELLVHYMNIALGGDENA